MINFDKQTPVTNHDSDLVITHGHGKYKQTIEQVAGQTPATEAEVQYLLAQSTSTGDGRSPYMWVTLLNGDLMLATYPQGDTYEVLVNGDVG